MLCVDGVGEWATTTLWHGRGTELTPLVELRFPHSLGMLYSAFTYFCGFKVDSGEYKLMGLAPLRAAALRRPHPRHAHRRQARRHLPPGRQPLRVPARPDHDRTGLREALRRTPARPRGRADRARVRPRGLRPAGHRGGDAPAGPDGARAHRRVHALPGRRGGAQLRGQRQDHRRGVFDEVWIQPAAGDAGGALGRGAGRRHGARRRARPPRDRAGRDVRVAAGPRLRRRGDRRLPDGERDPAPAAGPRPAGRAGGRGAGRGQDRRLVPGAHGVRAARLGARSILGDPGTPGCSRR